MASASVLNILRTIKERGTISRTDLQHLTGLSWGTITNTTRDLLNRNLIREEGAFSTKAGRKPVCLAINPSTHSLVGLDVGYGIVRCLVLNLAGETLAYEEARFEPGDLPATVLERGAAMVKRSLALPAVASRMCLGVGVAVPGYLDVKRGVVRFISRMPVWKDVPVREQLQRMIDTVVRVEHDPNCLALAERWFGEAGRAEHVLCLHLGDGVGMGILTDGQVYRGSQQFAGEFGHMTIDPTGPACSCGDHGCVEAYCSVPALREFVASKPERQSAALRDIFAKSAPTIAQMAAAAHHGDEAAKSGFERLGTYLGIGVANLVDLFNPDLIVLSGPMTAAPELFMPGLGREVEKHACAHSSRQMLISRLGERAMAMGACGTVLQSIFDEEGLLAPELAEA
jgi:predicted NBD/HSP70 family sugar kinase